MSHHITMTGPSAGRPLCGVDKSAAAERGETFSHLPYSGVAKFLEQPHICAECRAIWEHDDQEVCS